jgi:hypothetical protein
MTVNELINQLDLMPADAEVRLRVIAATGALVNVSLEEGGNTVLLED